MTAALLSRHKDIFCWLHTVAVVALLCAGVPLIVWSGDAVPSTWRAMAVFVLATLAFCQNIGLVHHCAHQLPKGPRRLGLFTARLLHSLGGLPYTRTSFSHRLHHAYLGTAQDPDRLGYQSTTTLVRRLRHLLMIGPLRARFAPVDASFALDAMSPERRAEYERSCRRDWLWVWLTHLALIASCGLYYPIVFSALLFANVLSNVREMAEHGDHGHGAYVNLDVSAPGVLFFSTPGFWFHAIHHTDPGVHYLDLPLLARTFAPRGDMPFLQRRSAVAYLFTGR